jgi:hypothetical protein
MAEFCIGKSDSEFLKVQILSRPHGGGDYWDGNWLDAKIELRAGGFRGRFHAYLRGEELKTFHDALNRLYAFAATEADFETMEEQLRIKIKGDGLGHFEAACVAEDKAGIGNRLSFSLNFDQTEIPIILSGLESVMKEFPVVGRIDA